MVHFKVDFRELIGQFGVVKVLSSESYEVYLCYLYHIEMRCHPGRKMIWFGTAHLIYDFFILYPTHLCHWTYLIPWLISILLCVVQSDQFYNAGWTEDVRRIVNYVHNKYPKAPLFTIGTSIGANILVLKCILFIFQELVSEFFLLVF